MDTLIGVVPMDGRRLDEATATPTMLNCIARLQNGEYDGVDEWLLLELMSRGWGYDETVQRSINNFQGPAIDALYLRGTQQFYAYGIERDLAAAFALFAEGISLADPSGRCHFMMGLSLQFGFGTAVDLGRAFRMYREGANRGCASAQSNLGYAYDKGSGVQEDKKEATRLYTLAHLNRSITASYNLGLRYYNYKGRGGVVENEPLGLALLREAAGRGHFNSIKILRELQEGDPCFVVPYSCWKPIHHIHRWVTPSIDLEIVSLQIARARPDGLVNLLPREIVHQISFYLCCRPQAYVPPTPETMSQGQIERIAWNQTLNRRHLIESRIERVNDSVDEVRSIVTGLGLRIGNLEQTCENTNQSLEVMQQQMTSMIQLLSSQRAEEQTNVREDTKEKRKKL